MTDIPVLKMKFFSAKTSERKHKTSNYSGLNPIEGDTIPDQLISTNKLNSS